MGESENIVNNLKIKNVIFNCGSYNKMERSLIDLLKDKNINYYKCINKLNALDLNFYFLNTNDYKNENDNSNVIYTNINNNKFMFMGDAGVETEKNIIDKYDLNNIDVLKIGHHGSNTSTSKLFIEEITPKISVISVGENNKYNHPNSNVLKVLENTKIYRTDKQGSIMIKIKNNKLQIEACSS